MTARPMEPGDYREGQPVPIRAEHPNRDLIVGAVVGAAALWAVPKVLDYVFGGWRGQGEEYDLEFEDQA